MLFKVGDGVGTGNGRGAEAAAADAAAAARPASVPHSATAVLAVPGAAVAAEAAAAAQPVISGQCEHQKTFEATAQEVLAAAAGAASQACFGFRAYKPAAYIVDRMGHAGFQILAAAASGVASERQPQHKVQRSGQEQSHRDLPNSNVRETSPKSSESGQAAF